MTAHSHDAAAHGTHRVLVWPSSDALYQELPPPTADTADFDFHLF